MTIIFSLEKNRIQDSFEITEEVQFILDQLSDNQCITLRAIIRTLVNWERLSVTLRGKRAIIAVEYILQVSDLDEQLYLRINKHHIKLDSVKYVSLKEIIQELEDIA